MLDWKLVTGWTRDYYRNHVEQVNLSVLSFKFLYPNLDFVIVTDTSEFSDFLSNLGCRHIQLEEEQGFGNYYDNIRYRALLEFEGPVIWVDPDMVAYKKIPLDKLENEYDCIGLMSEAEEDYTEKEKVDLLYSHLPFLKKPTEYERTGHSPGTLILKDAKKLKDIFSTVLQGMKYLANSVPYEWTEHVILTQTLPEILMRESNLKMTTLDKILHTVNCRQINEIWHHLTYGLDPYYNPFIRSSKGSRKVYTYLTNRLIEGHSITQNDFRAGLRKIRVSLV